MSKQELNSQVLSCIDESNSIDFALSRKNNVIGHTGIALIFDDEPLFTIDFGTSLAYCNRGALAWNKTFQVVSAASSAPVTGGLSINIFDHSEVFVLHKIKMIRIASDAEKEAVKNLISDLMSIDMGDYQLLSNNCRHYVMQAHKLIMSCDLGIRLDDEDPVVIARVLKEADDGEYCLNSQQDFLTHMKSIKEDDIAKLGGGVVASAAAVALIAYGISRLFDDNLNRNNNE